MRSRLLFALFMGLLFMAAFGVAVTCMLLHISAWFWAVPLLAAFSFGFVFIFRHGDRIAVATPGPERRSHALPNDT
jgi:hypothetical protein